MRIGGLVGGGGAGTAKSAQDRRVYTPSTHIGQHAEDLGKRRARPGEDRRAAILERLRGRQLTQREIHERLKIASNPYRWVGRRRAAGSHTSSLTAGGGRRGCNTALQAAVTATRPDGVKYHNQSVTRITDDQPKQVNNQNGARLVTIGPRAGGPVRGAAPCSLPTGPATTKTQTLRSTTAPVLSPSVPEQPSTFLGTRRHASQAGRLTGR
jgi:hypothetical protein